MKQNKHEYENLQIKKMKPTPCPNHYNVKSFYLGKFTKNVISLLQQAVTDQRKV